MFYIGIFYL